MSSAFHRPSHASIWSRVGTDLLSFKKIGSALSFMSGIRPSFSFRTGKGGFKVPRYQNTYRLSPRNPYKCEVVDTILKDVMDNSLQNIKYDPIVCKKLCQDISADVRRHIFKKDFDRYKFIVSITITEKLDQGIFISMGQLWDANRDTYSTHVFENSSLYAIGTVTALYYE